MNIAVLGTGTVGETIGSKLIALGHRVKMGSRTADNPKASEWVKKSGTNASQGTFAEAAAFGEILFNCTLGAASLDVLRLAGAENLKGKVLLDLANPLDFSKGMPPSLIYCNTDSLGEHIQQEFPELRVVKTLNTMWCGVMVDPGMVNDSNHAVFVCGNDESAKETAKKLLREFGWKEESIMDLGDLTAARGTEMLLPLWLRIYGKIGTGAFNIGIVK